MVELAKWDTEFFGYRVGTVKIGTDTPFDVTTFEQEAKSFRLVYVFSEVPVQIPGTILVDKKVVLVNDVVECGLPAQIFLYDKQKHDYSQLLELTLLSGKYSRFKLDKNFTNNEFERMYKIWLDNSINGTIAKYVIVHQEGEQINGFITLGVKPNEPAHIGLIAVSEQHQGKGIGGKLLQAADFYAHQNHCTQIEVPTQLDNIPAVKLYQKHNYKIQSITHIYHYWNI